MAIFDHENKNGIQLGTVGDRCFECQRKHRGEEDYEYENLDYKPIYKFWLGNNSHCMCLDCFKESLGNYILLAPGMEQEVQEEKPKAKKNSKKKEADKDGSETA